jgi:hypothetical protein
MKHTEVTTMRIVINVDDSLGDRIRTVAKLSDRTVPAWGRRLLDACAMLGILEPQEIYNMKVELSKRQYPLVATPIAPAPTHAQVEGSGETGKGWGK